MLAAPDDLIMATDSEWSYLWAAWILFTPFLLQLGAATVPQNNPLLSGRCAWVSKPNVIKSS